MKQIEDVKAPVLLITFNRPDNTSQVLEKIRLAKIKKLYIANDGPRVGNSNDVKAREEIKELIKTIDWDCELTTLFQEENMGCGLGPVNAITWAFENEDRLMVLEDDCVPALSFFTFCDEMLDMYAENTRIWLISGRSHQSKHYEKFKEQDYVFSNYAHTWGWATWKRCWNQFDIMMSDYPDFIKSGGALNILSTRKEGELLNRIQSEFYKNIEKKQIHVWDYQWGYAMIKNGTLGIVPAKNLVKNVGFWGTHASGEGIKNNLDYEEGFVVYSHPKFVLIDKEYELMHFKNHIKKRWRKTPGYKIVFQKLKRTVNWQ